MKKSWRLVAQHHEYTLLSCTFKSGDGAKFYVTHILSQLEVNKRGKTPIITAFSILLRMDRLTNVTGTEMVFVF